MRAQLVVKTRVCISPVTAWRSSGRRPRSTQDWCVQEECQSLMRVEMARFNMN